jgi:O-antigen ligase
MFLYFFESRERERFTRVLQIILITLGAFIALFLLARFTNNPAINRIFESVQNVILSKDVEDVGRDQLWTQAMTYFRANKWLGIGWTNFKNIFTLRGTHVHNIYIQLLCETGIIGFSIFAFFFVWNIRTTLRRIKTAKKGTCEYSWLMLSLFMQIYFLLYGITGNPLYDVEETILYFFGAGISYLPMLDDVAEDAGILSAKATLTRPIGLPIKGKYIK